MAYPSETTLAQPKSPCNRQGLQGPGRGRQRKPQDRCTAAARPGGDVHERFQKIAVASLKRMLEEDQRWIADEGAHEGGPDEAEGRTEEHTSEIQTIMPS